MLAEERQGDTERVVFEQRTTASRVGNAQRAADHHKAAPPPKSNESLGACDTFSGEATCQANMPLLSITILWRSFFEILPPIFLQRYGGQISWVEMADALT